MNQMEVQHYRLGKQTGNFEISIQLDEFLFKNTALIFLVALNGRATIGRSKLSCSRMDSNELSINTSLNRTIEYCTDEPFDGVTYHARVTVMLPIITFGLVANIFNILVFRHPRMKSSMLNWYLIVLACSDLLVLTCSFLMLSFPAIVEDFRSFALFTLAVYIQRWIYAVAMILQTCSVAITVLVSSHRFLGVCYPFLAQKVCTPGRVKSAISMGVAASCLFNISRWWELEIVDCFSTVYSQHGIKVLESHLRSFKAYYVAFMLCTYTVFMFFLPFIMLIIMNAMIMKAIHASYRMRQTMNRTTRNNSRTRLEKEAPYTGLNPKNEPPQSSETNETRTTFMLIAVVFVFLICNCLAFLNNVLEMAITLAEFSTWNDIYSVSVEISNCLVAINSTFNIFIYTTFSGKFRRILYNYLSCMGNLRRMANSFSTSNNMGLSKMSIE
uniref:G-protein coupled receptors family 1 profile domain-containing protein n=1 Tax=Romanomermis culicivorax TaxID=13658 RepID=A0A915KCE5_ROMCU